MGGLPAKEIRRHYHLIGAGGIGMGALASLLLAKGHKVSGSDLRENQITRRLIDRGAVISLGHNAQNVQGAERVVFSSAIDPNNPELSAARNQGIPVLPRARLLAELMEGQIGITVAGAHGKTTTTSMVSNLLMTAGLQPTAAIGGIINGTATNARLGAGKYFVAEVDESDGSFLFFRPRYSVITNIDFEHVDYYHDWENILKAYKEFIAKTSLDGMLFIYGADSRLVNLAKESEREFRTYGFSARDYIYAAGVQLDHFSSSFRCVVDGREMGVFKLNIPGRHNILNALAAVGLGLALSIKPSVIQESLAQFRGVQRRFQVVGQTDDILVIDDYAHHPTEINAAIQAARIVKPKRLVTVFQPHRYSRVKFLMDKFAESLARCDYLIVTDIYAASEKPIEGITAGALLEKIKQHTDKPIFYVKKEKILEALSLLIEPGDLVLMMGAGDITKIAHEFALSLQERNSKVLKV